MNRSLDVARGSLQEAFALAFARQTDNTPDRIDRHLASLLRKIASHFDPEILRQASLCDLQPWSASLPLPLAAHHLAGAYGIDHIHMPESCKILLEMGADPFARSPLPVSDHLAGSCVFGDQLNTLEIAISRSDCGLILDLVARSDGSHIDERHWAAFEVFSTLHEPSASKARALLRSRLEQRLLLDACSPGGCEPGEGSPRL